MKRLIQTQIESNSQKLETSTDVKFQNIIYYYWDGKKTVTQNQQVRIDFLGAVSEMEKLDYTFEKNFIGFQREFCFPLGLDLGKEASSWNYIGFDNLSKIDDNKLCS